MKIYKYALPAFFLIGLILASACSSQSDYTQIKSDNTSLTNQLDNLNQQYQKLQNDYDVLNTGYQNIQADNKSLKEEQSNLQAQNTVLSAENTALKTDLTAAQSRLTAAVATAGDLPAVQGQLAQLQTKYDSLFADFQSTYDALTQVKAVYPPENFATPEELSGWLAADDISERYSEDPVVVLRNALELQMRALNDGYVVNVNVSYIGTSVIYYRIYCSALVQDDTLYYWDVQSDGIDALIPDVNSFKWATAP